MTRYYRITTGLRGCYMPDSNYVYSVETRRELRGLITSEAEHQDGDGTAVGLSQKNIAWAAHHAWRKGEGAAILPWGMRGQSKLYKIEVSRVTQQEYRIPIGM